jgi:hypothetical protein
MGKLFPGGSLPPIAVRLRNLFLKSKSYDVFHCATEGGNENNARICFWTLNFGQNTDGNALSNTKKRKSCSFCLNRRRRGGVPGGMERTLRRGF